MFAIFHVKDLIHNEAPNSVKAVRLRCITNNSIIYHSFVYTQSNEQTVLVICLRSVKISNGSI